MRHLGTDAQEGFTLVEVMIAIGIMTVGSLGILSMHQAVTRANREAREMNTALAITETWIERVERDALQWTTEGINSPELLATEYLDGIAGQADEINWFKPVPADASESWAFDYFGGDTRATADTNYCVNLKLSWLRQGSSVRVDIRTYWLRGGHMVGSPVHADWVSAGTFRGAGCAAGTADSWDLGVAPNVNVIFASTVVTWLRRDAP